MKFTATEEQRVGEVQVDSAVAWGEALLRFKAAQDAAYQDLRQSVARELGGARYVAEGSAARAIVAAEGRRGR